MTSSMRTATSLAWEQGHIHLQTWGNPKHPTLLLCHGGLAHSRWFDAVAPLLASDYHLVCPDLPGHGHSSWLKTYHTQDFLNYFTTLVEHYRPYALIAHSLSAKICYRLRPQLSPWSQRMILLDPPPREFSMLNAITMPYRSVKYYESEQAILDRFRILPAQPAVNPDIQHTVAKESIAHTPGKGYHWLFDPNFWRHFSFKLEDLPAAHISTSATQTALIYGEKTSITTDAVRHDYQNHCPKLTLHKIPNAYHALMLDQPQTLARIIKDQLALLA